MTTSSVDRPGHVSLPALTAYLRGSGWSLRDEDGRTSLWRRLDAKSERGDVRVVLPAREDFADYEERLTEALRALSFVEQRAPKEVLDDIAYGAADNVSVRLTPNAPSGEAPLGLAQVAIAVSPKPSGRFSIWFGTRITRTSSKEAASS